MKTVGIDVCAAGYLAISLDEEDAGYQLLETEADMHRCLQNNDHIFVDIPVGLEEDQKTRECDMLLREKLGADYKESVIDPPVREAIFAPTYGEASMISYEKMEEQITMQSWSLSPQIRSLHNYLEKNEADREHIYESHPELLFQILNGGDVILQKKATKKGLRHRLNLLKEYSKYADDFFRDIKETYRRNQVEEDKIIDAMVLALFALRSVAEPVKTLPEEPPKDTLGLPLAIHYV